MKAYCIIMLFVSIIIPLHISEYIQTNVFRGRWLRPAIANAFAVISFGQAYPSFAQIPMAEDYYFGSGSKITRRETPVQIYDQLNPFDAPLKGYIETIKPTLLRMKCEAGKEQWDDILRDVKELKRLKTKYFGLPSLMQLADAYSISIENARTLESTRESIAFDVGQLSDIAISNRIVFFNTEDLKQVALLREEGGTVAQDPEEILRLLDSILDSYGTIAKILSS